MLFRLDDSNTFYFIYRANDDKDPKEDEPEGDGDDTPDNSPPKRVVL